MTMKLCFPYEFRDPKPSYLPFSCTHKLVDSSIFFGLSKDMAKNRKNSSKLDGISGEILRGSDVESYKNSQLFWSI